MFAKVSTAEVALIIAILSLLVSAASAYWQNRKRGALVRIVNMEASQPAVVLPYEKLPQEVRARFPKFLEASEEDSGFAFVTLVFANYGDSTGYSRLSDVNIREGGSQPSGTLTPRVSRFSYTIVPPHGVTATTLMLRGLPLRLQGNRELRITVEFAVGGVTERAPVGNPKKPTEEAFEHSLKILLEPELKRVVGNAGLT